MLCKHCVYWVSREEMMPEELRDSGDGFGDCHRYPKYEYTPGGYWCGEGMTESEYVAKKTSTPVDKKL